MLHVYKSVCVCVQILQIYPHFAFANFFFFKCVLYFFSIALVYFVLYSGASMGTDIHDQLYSDIIWTKLAVAK